MTQQQNDSKLVTDVANIIRPLVQWEEWIDQTLSENERTRVVASLQKKVSHSHDPSWKALNQLFKDEQIGTRVQCSALREACRQIATERRGEEVVMSQEPIEPPVGMTAR